MYPFIYKIGGGVGKMLDKMDKYWYTVEYATRQLYFRYTHKP